MGRAATALIAGAPDEAGALASELCALGFSARPCEPDTLSERFEAEPADAVVLMAPAPLPPARVAISLCGEAEGADAVIAAPAHPMQVAARLRSLLRLSVLEDCAALRAQDIGAMGHVINASKSARPAPAILYVGPPSPAFMRLQHAMAGAGAETIAAFSTFNAFDYLHERSFDAVVLSTLPTPDLAHTVCSAMRRNTRLYHTPTVLLAQSEDYGQAAEGFARGASDIVPATAAADEMRGRIMALADERQRRKRAKGRLEACRLPAILDEDTDLFASAFGRAHLGSLLKAAEPGRSPLSVVSLMVEAPRHVRTATDGHASRALVQFASMLRHCVRAEDLAVRLDGGRFYLALPDTSAAEARIVASRVVAIAECTAYESADPMRPFRVEVQFDITQAIPGDSADDLLARCFSELGLQRRELAAV